MKSLFLKTVLSVASLTLIFANAQASQPIKTVDVEIKSGNGSVGKLTFELHQSNRVVVTEPTLNGPRKVAQLDLTLLKAGNSAFGSAADMQGFDNGVRSTVAGAVAGVGVLLTGLAAPAVVAGTVVAGVWYCLGKQPYADDSSACTASIDQVITALSNEQDHAVTVKVNLTGGKDEFMAILAKIGKGNPSIPSAW